MSSLSKPALFGHLRSNYDYDRLERAHQIALKRGDCDASSVDFAGKGELAAHRSKRHCRASAVRHTPAGAPSCLSSSSSSSASGAGASSSCAVSTSDDQALPPASIFVQTRSRTRMLSAMNGGSGASSSTGAPPAPSRVTSCGRKPSTRGRTRRLRLSQAATETSTATGASAASTGASSCGGGGKGSPRSRTNQRLPSTAGSSVSGPRNRGARGPACAARSTRSNESSRQNSNGGADGSGSGGESGGSSEDNYRRRVESMEAIEAGETSSVRRRRRGAAAGRAPSSGHGGSGGSRSTAKGKGKGKAKVKDADTAADDKGREGLTRDGKQANEAVGGEDGGPDDCRPNELDPIMLVEVGEDFYRFVRPNGRVVMYNLDSLVDYFITTGDFLEPETRLPFSDDELSAIDVKVKAAGLSKPSVLEAKRDPSRFSEQKFQQDALVGLERMTSELVTGMLKVVEESDREEGEIRLVTEIFPTFADLFKQIWAADDAFAKQCMQHYTSWLQGPPNRPTEDEMGFLDIILGFLQQLQDCEGNSSLGF